MRPFKYTSAGSLDEAVSLLGSDGNGAVRPLAGGTDLLTLMKSDIVAPEQLIDIKRADGLTGGVQETADGVSLGALTTLAEIETHPLLRERYPALSEAAAAAATPQLRNMATIGGNLLQRPRCWYYRNPRFHCWLKGGDECQARDGENQRHAIFNVSPCVATHPSDLATALVALDAAVRLRGPDGERSLPLTDFFTVPDDARRTENVLRPVELVLEITIPAANDRRSTYLKAMDRKAWAFALVGVAAALRVDDGRMRDARLVLGGVAPIPWRVREAELLLDDVEPTPELLTQVTETALRGAQPLARNAYKLSLAQTLIRRALENLTGATK